MLFGLFTFAIAKECPPNNNFTNFDSISLCFGTNNPADQCQVYDYLPECLTNAIFKKESIISLKFPENGTVISLNSFPTTTELVFQTNVNSLVVVNVKFNSGLNKHIRMRIENDIRINPQPNVDDRAVVEVLSAFPDSFSQGNRVGPTVTLVNTAKVDFDYSAFGQLDLINYHIDNYLDEDNIGMINKLPSKLAIGTLIPSGNGIIGFNFYERCHLSFTSGIFNVTIVESGLQVIQLSNTTNNILFRNYFKNGYQINLRNRGIAHFRCEIDNIAPELLNINHNGDWEVYIEKGSWNSTQSNIVLNSNYPVMFLRTDVETPGLSVTGKDVILFMESSLLNVDLFNVKSLHLLSFINGTKTLKIRQCIFEHVYPESSGFDVTFGILYSESIKPELHNGATYSITQRLHIQNASNSYSAKTEESTVENFLHVNSVSFTDNSMITIPNGKTVYLNSSYQFPGNKYYIDYQESVMSGERTLLCQHKLDCSKFEVVFRNHDFFTNPKMYAGIGEPFEMTCTEQLIETSGCCEPEIVYSDFYKNVKCIGMKVNDNIYQTNITNSQVSDEEYMRWKTEISGYVDNILYSNSAKHAANFDTTPLSNITLESSDPILYYEIGQSSTGVVDSIISSGSLYVIPSTSNIIPVRSIDTQSMTGDFSKLDYRNVEYISLDYDQYSNYQTVFNKIKHINLKKGSATVEVSPNTPPVNVKNPTIKMEFKERSLKVSGQEKSENANTNTNINYHTLDFSSESEEQDVEFGINFESYSDENATGYTVLMSSPETLQTTSFSVSPSASRNVQVNISGIKSSNVTINTGNQNFYIANSYTVVPHLESNQQIYLTGTTPLNTKDPAKPLVFNNLTFSSSSQHLTFENIKYNKIVVKHLNLNSIITRFSLTHSDFEGYTFPDTTTIEVEELESSVNFVPSEFLSEGINLIIKNRLNIQQNSILYSENFDDQINLVIHGSSQNGFPIVIINDSLTRKGKSFNSVTIEYEKSEEYCLDSSTIYSMLYPNQPSFETPVFTKFEGYQFILCGSKLDCNVNISDSNDFYVEQCNNEYYKYTTKCFTDLLYSDIEENNHPYFERDTHPHTINMVDYIPYSYTCIGIKPEPVNISLVLESPHKSFKKGLSAGAIAGIVIAVVIVVVLIIVAAIIITRKRHNIEDPSQDDKNPETQREHYQDSSDESVPL